MATVQSTLKMFDAMTRPLQNITQGMNMMISTMHQMQAATDRNVNIDKTLTAAKHRIASAEAEIQQAIEQANGAQNRFNRSVQAGEQAAQKSERSFSRIGAGIIVLNQGLELAKKLWDGINKGMTFADDVLSTNTRLGMVNDGLRTQAQLQQQVLAVANKTRASYMGTADMVSKLGMFTQGVFKNNDGMLSFAERFNKMLVASGTNAVSRDIATTQMTQALGSGVLQGDELKSIAEAAPMLLKTLADGMGVARGQLKQMGADGKITADAIVKAFENQSKEIDALFAKMPMTFGGAMTIMHNSWIKWVGTLNAAEGPLQKITKLVQNFTGWLDSSQGQKFFDVLTAGIIIVSNLLYGAAQAAAFFYNAAVEYWPIIAGILASIAYIYLPAMTVALWGMVAPILAQAGAWLVAYWPILLVGAAVGAIIYLLLEMGVTSDQIVGGMTGSFTLLFAYIWNGVVAVWNIFAYLANFLWNLFVDPIYAIQKLIYDMDMFFYQAMYEMLRAGEDFAGGFMTTVLKAINKVIEGTNWLIDAINNIPGFDIQPAKLIDENNIHAASDSIKGIMNSLQAPTSDSKHLARLGMMKLMDPKTAFDKGYDAGKGIVDRISKAFEGFKLPGADGDKSGNIPNVGKVGEVGKINDTVDISSEDLKVMRDLAEMKSIQNFVTLTPTVQVTTGPITKETDVDEVIRRIGETMHQEIESSAQGVYDN